MPKVIEIILPILTSLFICFVTLYFAGRRSDKAMKVQQENHLESIKISERKYQQQLLINEENERLQHLPYLSLLPKNKINRFQGEMKKIDSINQTTIPFEIINEGAGIAFFIRLKYLDKDMNPNSMIYSAVAVEDHSEGGHNILAVREPIDTDALRVEKTTEFCLYLTAIDKDSSNINPTLTINWEFDIMFSDIQGREYSQTYSFLISTRDNTIHRITSYMPQLIE